MSKQTRQDEKRSGNLLVNFFRGAPGTPVEAPPPPQVRPQRRERDVPEPRQEPEWKPTRRQLIEMENQRRAQQDEERRRNARRREQSSRSRRDEPRGLPLHETPATWSQMEAASGRCTPGRNPVTGSGCVRRETTDPDWEAHYQSGGKRGLLGRLFGR